MKKFCCVAGLLSSVVSDLSMEAIMAKDDLVIPRLENGSALSVVSF